MRVAFTFKNKAYRINVVGLTKAIALQEYLKKKGVRSILLNS